MANREFVKLWCDHLRSEWYVQNFKQDEDGFIQMRTNDNKWSAFGILCNVHAQKNPEFAAMQSDIQEYCDMMYLIPFQVQSWIGIDNCIAKYPKPFSLAGKVYESVDDMINDNIPNFMIADAIEARFLSA